MNEAINLLTGLGPNALLAGAVIYLWRELERAREAHATVQAARLEDARETTTRMLALADRVHELVDTLDDVRRSRHD